MAFGKKLAAIAATIVMGLACSAASAQDLARGEQLFDLCAQCHGAEGGGRQLYVAPSIAGLSQWYVELQLNEFRSGLRGLHFDDITGMRMRPMSLTLASEEDVKSVAAYVASLPKMKPEPTLEGGDTSRGQAVYALCGACHGAKGEGIQPMNAPALNHSNDWYLLSQIEKFKNGVRGSRPGDSIGVLMMNIARTLQTDEQIRDVVAYIMTLEE